MTYANNHNSQPVELFVKRIKDSELFVGSLCATRI